MPDPCVIPKPEILKAASRETDTVVRYGEKFIIILPDTSEEDTIHLGNRIGNSVIGHVFIPAHCADVHIISSCGIASCPLNAADAADTALYSAKAYSKNRIVCFKGKKYAKNIR